MAIELAVAQSLLSGEASVEAAVMRLQTTLGKSWLWIRPLARRYVAYFSVGHRPRLRDVLGFLEKDRGFGRARVLYRDQLEIQTWLADPMQMFGSHGWAIPAIVSTGALAEWLGLTITELEWFADLKRLLPRDGVLGHYHCREVPKAAGGTRWIEAPKPRLKRIQQKILTEILDHIPGHGAAHGFVKGRSIRSFAAPHVGQRVVVRLDLKDYFPSVTRARVQALFRTAGYPEKVADLLGGLCTNSFTGRLPQGAPTSPAIANLCSYRFDCRLTGLAAAAGAAYTRYADDLAFSGGDEFERGARRFAIHAAAILLEEGFEVNHRKTRVMPQGVRQHLTGLTTNERLNVGREDFDLLKAVLTNCVRLGPESQNREGVASFRAHLEGRVGFVSSVNAAKGERLRKIFERIVWP